MEKKAVISGAELDILEVLWQAGRPMPANEIRAELAKTKNWERTTVLTLIRRLLEKKVVTKEKREVYYYSAQIKKSDYQKREVKDFVKRLFGGRSGDLIATLVQDNSLTKEEMEELRDYFNS